MSPDRALRGRGAQRPRRLRLPPNLRSRLALPSLPSFSTANVTDLSRSVHRKNLRTLSNQVLTYGFFLREKKEASSAVRFSCDVDAAKKKQKCHHKMHLTFSPMAKFIETNNSCLPLFISKPDLVRVAQGSRLFSGSREQATCRCQSCRFACEFARFVKQSFVKQTRCCHGQDMNTSPLTNPDH